jgi:hypothetical protein
MKATDRPRHSLTSRPGGVSVRRRLQGPLHGSRVLAPEIRGLAPEGGVEARATRERTLVDVRATRQRNVIGVSASAERNQLLTRPEPVARQPDDVAVQRLAPCFVVLRASYFHAICRPSLPRQRTITSALAVCGFGESFGETPARRSGRFRIANRAGISRAGGPYPMRKLLDSAVFWLALVAALTGLAAIALVGGTVNRAPHQAVREPWFVIGIVLGCFAVLAIFWAMVLFVAHRYAERQGTGSPPSPVTINITREGLEGVTAATDSPPPPSEPSEPPPVGVPSIPLQELPPVPPGLTRIFVSDLVREFGLHIVGRHFRDVQLVGPAVVTLLPPISMIGGDVGLGAGTLDDLFFEFPETRQMLVGIVAFQSCRFENVMYTGIAFAGPPAVIEHLKRGFRGEDVGDEL